MLTCDEAIELIIRAVDGRLEPRRVAELSAHLERCAACRTEAHTQAWVREVLVRRPAIAEPSGLLARVLARLESEQHPVWLDHPNWRTWTVRFLPVAAALLLLGVVAARARTDPPFDLFAAISSLTPQDAVFTRSDASGDALLVAILAGDEAPTPPSRAR